MTTYINQKSYFQYFMNFIFVSLIHNICKKCFIELRGLFSYEMFIFSIKVLRIYIINLFNICNLPLYIRLLSNPKIFDSKLFPISWYLPWSYLNLCMSKTFMSSQKILTMQMPINVCQCIIIFLLRVINLSMVFDPSSELSYIFSLLYHETQENTMKLDNFSSFNDFFVSRIYAYSIPRIFSGSDISKNSLSIDFYQINMLYKIRKKSLWRMRYLYKKHTIMC